jgi:hypothetical protein
MGLLDRKRKDRMVGHAMVPAGEGNLFTLEQAFDKG